MRSGCFSRREIKRGKRINKYYYLRESVRVFVTVVTTRSEGRRTGLGWEVLLLFYYLNLTHHLRNVLKPRNPK